MTFDHGSEVEDIAFFGNGNLFLSVGGTKTQLWDIRRNSSPVFSVMSNIKTVSSVKIIQNGKRVLTGSYDQFFKVYDPENGLKIVHQKKMSHPIMNFAITDSMENIAFGYANGQVEIWNRSLEFLKGKDPQNKPENEEDWEFYEKKLMSTLNFGAQRKDTRSFKFFGRGKYAKPGIFDVKIDNNQKKKL